MLQEQGRGDTLPWASWRIGLLTFPLQFQAPPYLPNVVATYPTVEVDPENTAKFLQTWQALAVRGRVAEPRDEALAARLGELTDALVEDVGPQVFLQDARLLNALLGAVEAAATGNADDDEASLCALALELLLRLLRGWTAAFRRSGRLFAQQYQPSFQQLAARASQKAVEAAEEPTGTYSVSLFYAAHLILLRVAPLLRRRTLLSLALRVLHASAPFVKAHVDTAVDYVCYTMAEVLGGAEAVELEQVRCNVVWESLGFYLGHVTDALGQPAAEVSSGWTADEARELVQGFGFTLTALLTSGIPMRLVLNPLVTALDLLAWEVRSPFARALCDEMLGSFPPAEWGPLASVLTRYFYLPQLWQRRDVVDSLAQTLAQSADAGAIAAFLLEQSALVAVMVHSAGDVDDDDLSVATWALLSAAVDRVSSAGLAREHRPALLGLCAALVCGPGAPNTALLASAWGTGSFLEEPLNEMELGVLVLACCRRDARTAAFAAEQLAKRLQVVETEGPAVASRLVLAFESAPGTGNGSPSRQTVKEGSTEGDPELWNAPEAAAALLAQPGRVLADAEDGNLLEKAWRCALRLIQQAAGRAEALAGTRGLLRAVRRALVAAPDSCRVVLDDVSGWRTLVRTLVAGWAADIAGELAALAQTYAYARLGPSGRLGSDSLTNAIEIPGHHVRSFVLSSGFLDGNISVVETDALLARLERALRFDEGDDTLSNVRPELAAGMWNVLYDLVRHDISATPALSRGFALRVAQLDTAQSHEEFARALAQLAPRAVSVYDVQDALRPSSGVAEILQRFLMTAPAGEADVQVCRAVLQYLLDLLDDTSVAIPTALGSLLLASFRLLLLPRVIEAHLAVLESGGEGVDAADAPFVAARAALAADAVQLLHQLVQFHANAEQLHQLVSTTRVHAVLNRYLRLFCDADLGATATRATFRQVLLILGRLWSVPLALAALEPAACTRSASLLWALAAPGLPHGLSDLVLVLLQALAQTNHAVLVDAVVRGVGADVRAVRERLLGHPATTLARQTWLSVSAAILRTHGAGDSSELVRAATAFLRAAAVRVPAAAGETPEADWEVARDAAAALDVLASAGESGHVDELVEALLDADFFTEALPELLAAPLHHPLLYARLLTVLLAVQARHPSLVARHVWDSASVQHLVLSVVIGDARAICAQQGVAPACMPFLQSQFARLEDAHAHVTKSLALRLLSGFAAAPNNQTDDGRAERRWRDALPCLALLLEQLCARFHAEQWSFASMAGGGGAGWTLVADALALMHDVALAALPETDEALSGSLFQALVRLLQHPERCFAVLACAACALLVPDAQEHLAGNVAIVAFAGRMMSLEASGRVDFGVKALFEEHRVFAVGDGMEDDTAVELCPAQLRAQPLGDALLRGLAMAWMDARDTGATGKLAAATDALVSLLNLPYGHGMLVQLRLHHYWAAVVRDSALPEGEAQILAALSIIQAFVGGPEDAKAHALASGWAPLLVATTARAAAAESPRIVVAALRCMQNLVVGWLGAAEMVAENLRVQAEDASPSPEPTLADAAVRHALVRGASLDALEAGAAVLAALAEHDDARRGLLKSNVARHVRDALDRALRAREHRRALVIVRLLVRICRHRDAQLSTLAKMPQFLHDLVPCWRSASRAPALAHAALALTTELVTPKENRPHLLTSDDLLSDLCALARATRDPAVLAALTTLHRTLLYDFQKARAYYKRGPWAANVLQLAAQLADTYADPVLSESGALSERDRHMVQLLLGNLGEIQTQLGSSSA